MKWTCGNCGEQWESEVAQLCNRCRKTLCGKCFIRLERFDQPLGPGYVVVKTEILHRCPPCAVLDTLKPEEI